MTQQDTVPAASPQSTLTERIAAVTNTEMAPWLWLMGSLLLAIIIGFIVHAVLFSILRRIVKHSNNRFLDSLTKRLSGPSRLVFPILGTALVLAAADATMVSPLLTAASRFNRLALVLAITWGVVRGVGFLELFIRRHRHLENSQDLEARRLQTQVTVLARTAAVLLWLIGLAIALMTFPAVRDVGASLLASAGIAGIITGIAARPIVENLLAGIQIAFTEPVRLEDTVVVEGQRGTVEEITPTYIVVKCLDDRRLIVPLAHIITKPIENWTRTSPEMLGSVTLHTDYSVDIETLRGELKRIVEASPHWDKRSCSLQAIDARPATLELRALVSAASGNEAFDLSAEVREKLIAFLQKNHPTALPTRP